MVGFSKQRVRLQLILIILMSRLALCYGTLHLLCSVAECRQHTTYVSSLSYMLPHSRTHSPARSLRFKVKHILRIIPIIRAHRLHHHHRICRSQSITRAPLNLVQLWWPQQPLHHRHPCQVQPKVLVPAPTTIISTATTQRIAAPERFRCIYRHSKRPAGFSRELDRMCSAIVDQESCSPMQLRCDQSPRSAWDQQTGRRWSSDGCPRHRRNC